MSQPNNKDPKAQSDLVGSDAERKKIVASVVRQLRGDEDFKRSLTDAVSDKVTHDRVFRRDVIYGILKFAIAATLLANCAILVGVWVSIKQATKWHFTRADEQLSNTSAIAMLSMTNRIVAEFETARISQTVETVARGQARSILESNVEPTVVAFQMEIRKRIDDLATEQDFVGTVTRAQANDFRSYLRLVELTANTNRIGQEADRAVQDINRIIEKDRGELEQRKFLQVHDDVTFGGPFTSDEVARFLISQTHPRNLEAVVNLVRNNKQILLVPTLIELLQRETDLRTADRISRAISSLTGKPFDVGNYRELISWWEKDKANYTNWPYSDFDVGIHEFASVHYEAALESFQKVLKIDAAADMTRALAEACYWEISETNKARALEKEFKDLSGRWAQWAKAKAELEAGSVSNATFQVMSFRSNYPGLRFSPDEGSHVWRKIDWALVAKQSTVSNSPSKK